MAMRAEETPPREPARSAARERALEIAGFAVLAALAVFFLAASWRRWTDPLIDFGRELYVPWRLSHGAVLYRDVDDFYGPLSQYANAALFRVFGPGLMVLVRANLAVFGTIAGSAYALFRRAFGAAAAFASTAVFVSVFGFSQFYGGNHNFATPYSHEATHGLLVCVLLALALGRWLAAPGPAWAATAGLLLGLSAVLKPEILLAAGAVTAGALWLGFRSAGIPKPSSVAAWAAGAAVPTASFWAYFAEHASAGEALRYACRGWLAVVASTRFTGDVVQAGFLGIDRPWPHLLEHGMATAVSFALAALFCVAARRAERTTKTRAVVFTLAAAAAMAWISWTQVDWLNSGRCLLGFGLVYAVLAAPPRGATIDRGAAARWMVAILSAALMARMFLNGRIYQFGFYQAALAAMLVPAVLIGDLPNRLRLGQRGRLTVTLLVAALLLPGLLRLTSRSLHILGAKTFSVGSGADRFLVESPSVEATGAIVDRLSRELGRVPEGQKVLVLPEGEMINYLSRKACPVAPFFFFSAATADGQEAALVRQLDSDPPDWVVVVSRDLREYGIGRYGTEQGQGLELLQWVSSRYRPVERMGGDPLDPRQRGAVILARKR
jgi:hypothetical protein